MGPHHRLRLVEAVARVGHREHTRDRVRVGRARAGRAARIARVAMSRAAGLGTFSAFWRTGGHCKTHALRGVTDVLLEVREAQTEAGGAGAAADGGGGGGDAAGAAPTEQYEMVIECVGEKANRPVVWHSLMPWKHGGAT